MTETESRPQYDGPWEDYEGNCFYSIKLGGKLRKCRDIQRNVRQTIDLGQVRQLSNLRRKIVRKRTEPFGQNPKENINSSFSLSSGFTFGLYLGPRLGLRIFHIRAETRISAGRFRKFRSFFSPFPQISFDRQTWRWPRWKAMSSWNIPSIPYRNRHPERWHTPNR